MDLTDRRRDAAAYHGRGWRPRDRDLGRDIELGLWAPLGCDAEWAPLRAAMLVLPGESWPAPDDWNAAQLLEPVDFAALRVELLALAAVLRGLGVEVVVGEAAAGRGPSGAPLYNACFVRDQFLMTPEGAVVGRMGSWARAGEERLASALLTAYGVPVLRTVRGDGSFEGADALWIRPDLVAIGTGNRTNRSGAEQVRDLLAAQGVACRLVPLPRATQHLLGLVQLVGPDLAVVRGQLAPPELLAVLRDAGVGVVIVEEGPAVRGQAMNFVPVDERKVVMVDGWPDFGDRLARAGIEVCTTVACPQLVMAAGGLACATGILRRALAGGGR